MRISDWSSDVCSSDLALVYMQSDIVALGIDPVHFAHGNPQQFGSMRHPQLVKPLAAARAPRAAARDRAFDRPPKPVGCDRFEDIVDRSEERRVGKGWVRTCRSRGSPYH